MKNKYYLTYNNCIDCNKPISYGATRCSKCNGIINKTKRLGKNNPNYKHGRISEKRKRIEKYGKQDGVVQHHIFGKEYEDLLPLTRSLHQKIHTQTYWYILDKYGKKGIMDYICWFFKHYKNSNKE